MIGECDKLPYERSACLSVFGTKDQNREGSDDLQKRKQRDGHFS